MSNPLIRACNHFVVMEPGCKEQFLNAEETLTWLREWLDKFDQLPSDLQKQNSTKAAAQHLMDTACELEIEPGFSLQWFAVRLDPQDP